MTEKRIKQEIIDNTGEYKMYDMLNSETLNTTTLDISTGYFDVGGYGLIRKTIEHAVQQDSFQMRLILGKQALISDEKSFEEYAQTYGEDALSLKTSLDCTDLKSDFMTDTSSLIRLLNLDNVEVRLGSSRFNHSKCYIFDEVVFIGSSNFTRGGMTGNYELNAGLYQPTVADMTRKWFERMWADSVDTKADLIKILECSKFGTPPPPYEVYIKMLFEKYRDLLSSVKEDEYDNKIMLTKFQKNAVSTAMFIISEFGGAMIADATGLGKTNIGMEIISKKMFQENRKVLLVAPAQVLKTMWATKLQEIGIRVRKEITMESLGRDEVMENLNQYRNIDFVIVDESQNFRSKTAKRTENLAKIMSVGKRKQVLLMSATPINNSIMDLYYQISIITRRDDTYFSRHLGITDLYQHLRKAANSEEGMAVGLQKIQLLLDTIMIRRTRSYIKDVYPDDMINGVRVKFPTHNYKSIRYSLSELYGNIFKRLLDAIGSLTMAPYGFEQYNDDLSEDDKKIHKVRAHLQVILLLKRFESSVKAIKKSLSNKIKLYEYVQMMINDNRMFTVSEYNKLMTKWNLSGLDEDDNMENVMLESVIGISTEKIGKNYDMKRFREDIANDLKTLNGILNEIEDVTVDTKIDEVIKTILVDNALKTGGKKVLIFTEYAVTATYILDVLKSKFPHNIVECITGNTNGSVRAKYIKRFAPDANLIEDETLDEKEIDILISTEVLSEGNNLQDCNYVINYDLPWNPMRIVQRIGRVDRLTSKHDVIQSRACYPDTELDAILKLRGKLIDKIGTVNKTIGLQDELLGEVPTPKQYNVDYDRIKTLSGESAKNLIEGMERESDIMPESTPLNEISRYVREKGIKILNDMPIGRRSGKRGDGEKCILAYEIRYPERRVIFAIYDYSRDDVSIPDDEYDVLQQAACRSDEQTFLPMDGSEHRESFEQLLQIDGKVRTEIINHIHTKQTEAKKERDGSYDKLAKKIMGILITSTTNGNISKEKSSNMYNILNSDDVRPWENDLKEIVLNYKNNNDINELAKKIIGIGKHIEITTKPVIEDNSTTIKPSDMTLIGAMFITDEITIKNKSNIMKSHM